MAESSITEESLKSKLTKTLRAVHVEVTDISGTSLLPKPLLRHLQPGPCLRPMLFDVQSSID